MNEHGVFPPDLQRKLTDGFQERQSLDVAGGATNLGDDNVRPTLFAYEPDAVFYLIGDVRDDLHRLAKIIATTFLLQHCRINLPAGEVVESG